MQPKEISPRVTRDTWEQGTCLQGYLAESETGDLSPGGHAARGTKEKIGPLE